MAVNAQFIAGKWQQGAGAPLTKLAPEDQSILWQATAPARPTCRPPVLPRARRLWLVASPISERIAVVQRFAALLKRIKRRWRR